MGDFPLPYTGYAVDFVIISIAPSNAKFLLVHIRMSSFKTLDTENIKYHELSSMQLSGDEKCKAKLFKKRKRKMLTEKYFLNTVK